MQHGLRILCLLLAPSGAQAGAVHTAVRWELGLVGGLLDFLGSQPFVLLFLTLALGTRLGRQPRGFIKLGSMAGILLVGILISLAAHRGRALRGQPGQPPEQDHRLSLSRRRRRSPRSSGERVIPRRSPRPECLQLPGLRYKQNQKSDPRPGVIASFPFLLVFPHQAAPNQSDW
jgi:hypothetical protein